MGEFFKGWRRKVGVMTLVLACVLSVGWVRSQTLVETIEFQSDRRTVQSLISGGGSLCWQTFCEGEGPKRTHLWLSVTHAESGFRIYSDPDFWSSYLFGFAYKRLDIWDSQWYRVLMIPYWSIVAPLTLLSAYLLLSKPRIAKPKKEVESTTADRA